MNFSLDTNPSLGGIYSRRVVNEANCDWLFKQTLNKTYVLQRAYIDI